MLRNAAMAMLWVSACSFSKQLPDEGDVNVDGGVTTPAIRCQDSDLALCVDFENAQVKDALGASLVVQNVNMKFRVQEEGAAELVPMSLIKILDTPKLDISPNLSVEMWTKPLMVPMNADKQVGLFDVYQQYQMNFEQDRHIECELYGVDRIDSNVTLTIGAWHHVACTYDGREARVYVDGRVARCKSSESTYPIPTGGIAGAAIGANMAPGVGSAPSYKNHFVGHLDNVHVYARTLDADAICAAWGGGNCSGSCPPPE